MAPVQSKLVPYKKLHQTSLIPVRASTPHGPTNFMSLGRIVVDKTTHHDNSQHIHLQCQGAACKQVWFHYKCIGKPKNWSPANNRLLLCLLQ